MARKSVRAKRATKRSAKKQSFFDKLFTFPRLAAILFVALFVVFLYQVMLPGKEVKGASDSTTDFQVISKTEAQNVIKSKEKNVYLMYIRVFNDNNSNKKFDSNDTCKSGAYTLTAKNSVRTRTLDIVFSTFCSKTDSVIVKSWHSPNTLTLTTPKNYKATGLTYSDGRVTNKSASGNSVKLTGGFGPNEGFYTGTLYDNVDFGLHKK